MFRSFVVAVQFLTRFPTPPVIDWRPEDIGRSSVFFPAVGLLIGLVLVATGATSALTGTVVAALLVVVAWVWATGALHVDGLADVADAFGAAHRDPERFLQVLRDPHLGTFGVLAVVLVVVAKLILIEDVLRHGGLFGLLLVPAWARFGVLAVSVMVEPLAPGSGAHLRWSISRPAILVNFGLLVVASAVLAPFLLVAPFVALGVVAYWRLTINGVTGDCLGASIEVMECVLLLALVVGAAALRI